MRTIILSAGQGRRLLPLTESTPKCLLSVQDGTCLLGYQLRSLAAAGIDEASVIVGFGASKVEEFLATRPADGIEVTTVFNPFFGVSDNLATVWLARGQMQDDFVLLNGDTLFEADVLRALLASRRAALTLAISVKDRYDDDDMKVSLAADGRLKAVSKTLAREAIDGESIGLMYFRGEGVAALRQALDARIRDPDALKLWYLSIIDELASSLRIETADVTGLWWGEVDDHEDLTEVRKTLSERVAPPVDPLSSHAG
jgi:choline kinase